MFKYLRSNFGFVQDIIIFLLFLLYFHTNLVWTIDYFFQAASYEYLFLLVFALLIFVISAKGNLNFKNSEKIEMNVFVVFFFVIVCDLVNVFFLHYQIISASLMLLGMYAFLGQYLERKFWNRGLFLIGIIALSLPFAEHIQTFIGFPLRLLTAKLVSLFMGILGASNVTDAAVIVTENNATSIDVPCSGVKSLYTGLIVLLVVFFLKNVRFSLKMIGVTLLYFLVLFFFNVWRVFSLVYIYDVIGFLEFGDAIHVGIGILGFVISTYLLWFLVVRFVIKKENSEKEYVQKRKYKKLYVIILLLISLALEVSYVNFSPVNGKSSFSEYNFDVSGIELIEEDLGEKEREFFDRRDVQFVKKYFANDFSLLLIASNSWKTHHNPEFCIQGIGHTIDGSEIVQFGDLRVRKLSLNGGQDTVFYWFVSEDRTVMDYSERVWEGLMNPKRTWVLVEVGVQGQVNMTDSSLEQLFYTLNSELKDPVL